MHRNAPLAAAHESERRSSVMDCEFGRQLALEVEANLLALRLTKQLDRYRDNRETIVGCQFVAGLLAFLTIGAFASAKPLSAAGIFVLYAAIALIILPTLNYHNTRAWKRMALPLVLLSALEDFDIIDERTLRSGEPVDDGNAAPDARARLPEGVCRANIDQLGAWLTARGLYVRLPAADGSPPGFLCTSLGARLRRRLDLDDVLPGALLSRARAQNLSAQSLSS